MAQERIDIVVSENGSRVVKRNIEDIGNSSKKAATGVQQLQRLLGGLVTAATIQQLARTADAYTTIGNSLRQVTSSAEQLTAVQNELFNISQKTRSSFEANADVYRRFALAGKDLGVSQNDILDLTKSVNQAIALSGASGAEAQAGLIQFSQGLASGTLRGDELRSVLEQLPAVADILAKQLGVTRGELRNLGADGKITSEVILEAFKNASAELDANFGKVVPTISSALTVLQNAFVKFLGELDQASGVSRTVAEAIIFLAEHMEVLGKAALVVGSVIATQLIGAALAPLVAFLATPIGLIVALTAAFVAFGDQIIVSTDGVTNAFDLLFGTFQVLYDTAMGAIMAIANAFGLGYSDISKFTSDFGDFLLGTIGGVMKTLAEIVAHAFNGILIVLEKVMNAAIWTGNKVRGILDKTREDTAYVNLGRVDFDAIDSAASGNAMRRQYEAEQRQIEQYKAQQELKKMIGGTSGLGLADRAAAEKEAEEAFRRQKKLLEDIRGPQISYAQTMKDLSVLLKTGKIDTDQYNEAVRDLNIQVLELDNTIQGGFQRGLLQINKEFSNVSDMAAKTLTNAFQSAEDALVSFVRTGKLEFGDLVNSILDDLARLAVKQYIMAPLANMLGLGGAGGSSGGGAGGGIIGDLVGKGIGWLGGLMGFANGGQFQVGGTGGTDSQLVAFRASPNETVSITRPDQQGGDGSGNNFTFTFQIDARGADSDVDGKIEAAINKARPTLMKEAVAAVSNTYRRNPSYLPQSR